jgi:hypothetical protein
LRRLRFAAGGVRPERYRTRNRKNRIPDPDKCFSVPPLCPSWVVRDLGRRSIGGHKA